MFASRCNNRLDIPAHLEEAVEHGMKWNAGDLDSMVAIRRVKRLIQFSVLAVLLATLLLFLQWNEISDSEKFNTARRGMDKQFIWLIYARD